MCVVYVYARLNSCTFNRQVLNWILFNAIEMTACFKYGQRKPRLSSRNVKILVLFYHGNLKFYKVQFSFLAYLSNDRAISVGAGGTRLRANLSHFFHTCSQGFSPLRTLGTRSDLLRCWYFVPIVWLAVTRASACTGQECRYHTRLQNNSTFLFFAPLRHFLHCIALKRRHLYYDRTLGVLRSRHLPLRSNLLFSNVLKVLQGEPGKQQYEK